MGIEVPRLCYKEGMRPDGNCRTCMVEIKGERVLAPSCCRYPTDGMEVTTDSPRARDQPEDGARAAALGRAGDVLHARLRARSLGEAACSRQAALRRPASAGRGSLAPGDGRQPRRLHPVQPLRAGLPRGAGERRHRLRFPRRAVEDRVRPRRSDGRVHVRRLRRVCPGLSDRRADARPRRREDCAPTGRWSRSARIAASDASSPTTSRTTRFSSCRARTVRRIRAACASRAATASTTSSTSIVSPRRSSASPASPNTRISPSIPTTGSDVFREASWDEALDFAAKGLRDDSRHSRQAVAGRLRVGQGHQRRSLSLPEARANRIRLEQRRSLHAAVPCVERGRADGGHQLRRGLEPGARRRQGGSDLRDRREPDGQSPGRRDLDEERRQSAAPS